MLAVLFAVTFSAGPDYTREVFPILQKYCVGCHNAEDLNGGLNMADFKEFTKGGKKGAPFVAGKSIESRMILMRTGRARPVMPPKGNPAPKDNEWKLLAEWIDAGAHGPSVASSSASASTEFSIAKKHTKPSAVDAVAFSADGKLLALARGTDVFLIDPSNGNVVRSLATHSGRVTALRFSRKGNFLATASGVPGKFGEVRLYDPTNGKMIRTLGVHRDAIYGLDVSADGKLIASAGYDREIAVWDVDAGKKKYSLKGHNDAVYALAFSPDGSKLASSSGDRTFKLWNVEKGERLDTFSQPLQDQYAVAFTSDGRKLFGAGADNRVRVWAISKTGAEGSNPLVLSKFAHEGPILQLTMSAGGWNFATSSQDGGVKIWRADSVTEIGVLERQSDWPAALSLSPDGSLLAVGRHDGSAAIYSTATKKIVRALDPKPTPPVKPITLTSLSPPGAQRGASTEIVLVGDGLLGEGVVVKSNNPSVKISVAGKEKGADGKDSLRLAITAEAALKRGTNVEISATNAAGTSKPLSLTIDEIPQVAEKEGLKVAQSLTTPVCVWGTISKRGDMDSYVVDAKAGESLVFDVAAKSMGSKLDAEIEIFDADGRPIEMANNFDDSPDPLVILNVKKSEKLRVVVRDALLNGSAEHRYKLSIGALPVVTGVFPLGVSKGKMAEITLIGANLNQGGFGGWTTPNKAFIDASKPGDVAVNFVSDAYRIRKTLRVAVGELPEIVEAEPNDDPKSATPMSAPGVADGRIQSTRGEDVDFYRFSSKKGERWIVETEAARRGSPVDTKIEVLTADGKPIPKVRLQAVRDANIHFRGIDSKQLEIRTTNWTEMELNQYLYMAGEVGKYFRLPQGPDSGFLFYARKGVRLCYFDSSPTSHALGDPIYIVEPLSDGATPTANGLPTFTINHENDDGSDRTIGRDSRLSFIAPADGEYLLRVADSRAKSGDRYAYRAIVRHPSPDFNVSLSNTSPTVGAGSGQEIDVFLDRIDGFDGEVTLNVDAPPGGFTISNTTIEAGHNEAKMVVFAAGDAKASTLSTPIKVTATATINGKKVTKPAGEIAKIALAPRPKLLVRLEPRDLTIRPGQTITAELSIERHGYTDRATFDFPNLPHGVFIDNIGLSGILIRPMESKRQVIITARPWVQDQDRPFFAQSKEDKQASPPLMLHVRKNRDVALEGK